MIKDKTSNEAKVKGQKPKASPSGIKSRSRVKERGEVFTEPREVKAMCDLCEPDISRIDKKVLEPGCGTGNFLTEILAVTVQQKCPSKFPGKMSLKHNHESLSLDFLHPISYVHDCKNQG